MSAKNGRKIATQLPNGWLDFCDSEYERWRLSMRCEGQGTTADWYRYLIRKGLEVAKREHD